MPRLKIRQRMTIDEVCDALGYRIGKGKNSRFERRKNIGKKHPELVNVGTDKKREYYADDVHKEVMKKYGDQAVAA